MSGRKKAAVFIVPLIVGSLSLGLITFGRAETSSQVNWMTGAPSISKEAEYASLAEIPNGKCTLTTVKVARTLNPLLDGFEQHCLKQTFMGQMTDIYYTYGIVQPNGYSKAYPVNYVAGGNPVAEPIPNQVQALVTAGYSQGPGVIHTLFKQLSNHMKLELTPSGWRYNISGSNAIADYLFRYSDGTPAVFNGSARSFSTNGRYMVADATKGGFVRVDLMNLTSKPIATTLPKINNYNHTAGLSAIDNDGRMAVIAYNAAGGWGVPFFKLVDTSACAHPETEAVVPQTSFNCPTTDLLPAIRQAIPEAAAIDIHSLQFVNDRTISFSLQYRDQQGAMKYASYSMTAFGQTKRLKDYLALGDSFISGEGAFSYRVGTDTPTNACHQSTLAHPYLNSAYFASFASVACSGARTNNIVRIGDEKTHQVKTDAPNDNEVISAVTMRTPGITLQSAFLEKDNPEAVTLSIGGNDIGFSGILQKCINPFNDFRGGLGTDFTCYPTYEDRVELTNFINSQFSKLRSLYETVKKDGGGGRRVYVIGYPQIAKVDGDCGLNVALNAEEVKFAYELVGVLNAVIKRAADEAGVQYVDMQHAFDGHRLCEAPAGRSAVNGITIVEGPGGKIDVAGSYHPTALGHELMATAIAEQTDNLHKPMPGKIGQTTEMITAATAAIYEGAPKTGRPVKDVRNLEDLIGSLVSLGESISATFDAKHFLIKPGGTYAATIGAKPVGAGSFVADASGKLYVTGAVAASTPTGFQTFSISGNDIFGTPVELRQTVYVAPSVDDSDGDGVPNATDVCLLTTQSGVDYDQDGVDDACDPIIAQPPATPPGGGVPDEGIVWWDNAVLPAELQTVGGP